MTQAEFLSLFTSVARAGLTVVAGLMAAHGLEGHSDAVVSFGMSLAVLGSSLAWSWIEKHKLAQAVVSAAPSGDVEHIAEQVGKLSRDGASPLVVAHMAQTLSAIAVAEFQAAQAPVHEVAQAERAVPVGDSA